MAELFTDLASSTLAAGIIGGATSLNVQAGDGALYPSPITPDFYTVFLFKKLTGESEFVSCTTRSGDTMTIGATTRAYNAGDVVELRPTSAFFNALAAGASSVNIQQGGFLYGVDTGAADAYVIAMTPTAVTLLTGQELRVKIDTGNTNTGACTLKVDALTAINIKTASGADPVAGSIRAGFTHTFHYDGTNMVMQNTGLSLTSAGFNAEAKQVKNVAAGTAATDAATIGGTEALSAKTITGSTIAGGERFYQTEVDLDGLSTYTFTGIPSWATKVSVIFDGTRLTQQDWYRMRIGPVGGVVSTGYRSTAQSQEATVNKGTYGSSFFPITGERPDIGHYFYGVYTLVKYDDHVWNLTGQGTQFISAVVMIGHWANGRISLAGALERIEIYVPSFAWLGSAGQNVRIMWE